ncbi:MAG: hypothetical protein M1333_00655, partial [Patescibacteria group bacterium]|nr:hypothetical protein [Patescibacteria group bacterium]
TPPEASAPVQETSQPVEENKQDSSSSDAQSRNSGNGVAGVVAIIFSVAAVVGGVLFLLRSDKSQAKD